MNCITSVTHSTLPVQAGVHAHDEHELIFIVSGTAYFKSSGGESVIHAPALVSIGHLEKHTVRSAGEYERYVVTLRPEQLPVGCDRLQLFFAPQFQALPVEGLLQSLRTLLELLLEEFRLPFSDREEGSVWVLQTLLLLLYRRFPERFPQGNGSTIETVRLVQSALEQDLSREISLPELSEQFHISVSHLSHSFKSITGVSLLHYRLMVKLATACDLLANTDDRISQIGERSGFPDANSFSRAFRKSVGCTPRQYREQHRGLSGPEE